MFCSRADAKRVQPLEPPIEYERERVQELETRLDNCFPDHFTILWRSNDVTRIDEFQGMNQSTNEQVNAKIEFGEKLLKDFSDKAFTERIVFCSIGIGLGAATTVGFFFIPWCNFINTGVQVLDNFLNTLVFCADLFKLSFLAFGGGFVLVSIINFFRPSQAENEYSGYQKWLIQRKADTETSASPFIELSPAGLAYGVRVLF